MDYESLDQARQEYAVKRLEAALKSFGPGFHVYQYLFKRNRPDIPFAGMATPLSTTAIEQRRQFFEAKRDNLYRDRDLITPFLLEGARSKTGIGGRVERFPSDASGRCGELKRSSPITA